MVAGRDTTQAKGGFEKYNGEAQRKNEKCGLVKMCEPSLCTFWPELPVYQAV